MFFVPHDIGKVIELLGGEETFLKRLDFFHTSGLADIGNEPVFLTVYMPHYAGRPALSAKRAHSCQLQIFTIQTGYLLTIHRHTLPLQYLTCRFTRQRRFRRHGQLHSL
jgi:hypothetical protein